MNTSPYAAPYPAPHHHAPVEPVPLAASRLLLWLPVPAIALMGYLEAHSFLLLMDGAPDVDPLYGLGVFFIAAVAVVLAVINLVIAATFSFAGPRGRSDASLGCAIWTACAGVGFVALMGTSSASDPMLVGSANAGDQVVWDIAAGAVTIVPLVAVLVARALRR